MAGESDVAVAQVVHEEEDEVGFVEGIAEAAGFGFGVS